MTFTHQCFLLTVDITVFFNETTYDASDVDGPEVPLLFLSNPSSVNITIYMIIAGLLLGIIKYASTGIDMKKVLTKFYVPQNMP